LTKNRYASGRLIAIDGIDQSGKRTQTELLVKRVVQQGFHCAQWDFPVYETAVGRLLKAYLQGTRHDNHTIHLLYAANKWELVAKMENQLRRGCILIANRYTPSNLAYGTAHGLPLNWLHSLETGLPKADRVIILNVPTDVSFKRKSRNRDVHEEDLAYLERVRRSYLRLGKAHRWAVIDGALPTTDVSSRIWKIVAPILRSAKRTH